eukprot:8167457-Pyramimonas_sp.AAC.1
MQSTWCNTCCARYVMRYILRNPCVEIFAIQHTLCQLGGAVEVVQSMWSNIVMHPTWCNLWCSAIHVVQYVLSALGAATCGLQSTWCNICGGIYVVRAS